MADRSGGRGQSLVEFGVLLPLLLVLLLAIADLGRVFAAGIVVQAASRDGAEAAAQDYVQLVQASTINPSTLYATLHAKAESVACAEVQRLPGVTVDGSGACTMPVIAACVHDSGYTVNGAMQPGDPACGTFATGSDVSSCSSLQQPWSTSLDGSGLPYMEVRICYRFDMLTQVQLLHFGPLFLEQTSTFVAATYQ